MKTLILHLPVIFLIIITINGCTPPQNKKANIRAFEFNDKGLKVITSAVNEKSGTMSILYGNSAALNYSIKKSDDHIKGEVFKLVTFEQQNHEFWYGSKINGKLLYVETIETFLRGKSITPIYTVKYYSKDTTKYRNQAIRINFILNQKAAVFP